MPVESSTYIGQLDATYPLQDDDVSQGDDHLRLLKLNLQNTFPNFNKALTATIDELDRVAGVTSSIQNQLDACVQTDKGDQSINGSLTTSQSMYVIADTPDPFDGFGVRDGVGQLLGAFFFEEATSSTGIVQKDANDNNETRLDLTNGKASLTSETLSTDAVSDGDLTTKGFSDGTYLGNTGNQAIAGELQVQEAVYVNAVAANNFDGFVVIYQGFNRAGFVFNESTGAVEIVQNNSFGDNETVLTLDNGQIFVNGAPVALGAVNAQSAGASGTFEDNNGNTVTVVNGLITSLS